ncbi:MAG: hypothetical protein RLZZ393_2248 [Pseudomonadota bacterium]|jgi:UPF0042 nucleotide-binding protein
MRLVFVSGLSGSGKSVALHMLEDLDFYCVDNIPAALLKPFITHTLHSSDPVYRRTAVGIDARNTAAEIATIPRLIDELQRSGIQCELIYLVANDDELLRRFAETRRRHPLSRRGEGLREAIAAERNLLEPIANAADLTVDTTRLGVHDLRELMRRRVEPRRESRMSIQFASFGFKHGIPGDADFVFDARTLPNPYWESTLRGLTGRDPDVARFLEQHPAVEVLLRDIEAFIEGRIPEYHASNRRYLTVAVGCTGGRHRSVYIADRLATRFNAKYGDVSVRHSNLPGADAAAAAPTPPDT